MPYLTADEIRERATSTIPSGVEDAELERIVAEFEEIVEEYRGVAYVPRTATETVLRVNDGLLLLRWPKVRSITSLTVAGDVIDDERYDFDGVTSSLLYPGGYWGSGATVVVYEHGFTEPPAILQRATVEYVERTLSADQSGTSRDIIAQSYEGGFTRYSTPDAKAGRPTGWLDVDRLLNTLEDYRSLQLIN